MYAFSYLPTYLQETARTFYRYMPIRARETLEGYQRHEKEILGALYDDVCRAEGGENGRRYAANGGQEEEPVVMDLC